MVAAHPLPLPADPVRADEADDLTPEELADLDDLTPEDIEDLAQGMAEAEEDRKAGRLRPIGELLDKLALLEAS